jgi:hypothetical protein
LSKDEVGELQSMGIQLTGPPAAAAGAAAAGDVGGEDDGNNADCSQVCKELFKGEEGEEEEEDEDACG